MTTQNDAATPTKAKPIPSNLSEIELQDDFEAIDKVNTVKQLEAKLRDVGVAYLSSDNKAMLVWRYLDATAQRADDAAQDAPDANSDDTVIDHSTQDTPDGGKVGNVTDQNQADKPAENQIAQSGDVNDNQATTDKPSNGDAEVSSGATESSGKTETKNSGSETATNPDNAETGTKTDTTEANTPASDDKKSKANQDGDAQPQAPKNDAKTPRDDAPKAPNVVSDDEVIAVENTGAFNMLEPASMTLLKAREVTKITIKRNVSKAKVMGNIEQFNRTRGNILKVVS